MQESSKTNEDQDRQNTTDSEATSKETLEDLEESEADSNVSDSGSDPGPSPDGLLDERGEVKDAGPM